NEQFGDEVLVFLPERAQLGGAQVFLVEAPAGEWLPSAGPGCVGVLDLDQPVPPAFRKRGRFQVDAVDAKAVKFFERRELSRYPFDAVGELCGLFVAVGDREDVDLG